MGGIWQSTSILLEHPGRKGVAELEYGLMALPGNKDLMFVSKRKGQGSRRKDGHPDDHSVPVLKDLGVSAQLL